MRLTWLTDAAALYASYLADSAWLWAHLTGPGFCCDVTGFNCMACEAAHETTPGEVREFRIILGAPCGCAGPSTSTKSVDLDEATSDALKPRMWALFWVLPAVPMGTAPAACASCMAASPRPPADQRHQIIAVCPENLRSLKELGVGLILPCMVTRLGLPGGKVQCPHQLIRHVSCQQVNLAC